NYLTIRWYRTVPPFITGPASELVMEKACDFAGCSHVGSPATCSLNKLGVGCSGKVVEVGGTAEVRRRLLEMGFCNGASVEVLRRAPLGDPIAFKVRGYCLSLRDA